MDYLIPFLIAFAPTSPIITSLALRGQKPVSDNMELINMISFLFVISMSTPLIMTQWNSFGVLTLVPFMLSLSRPESRKIVVTVGNKLYMTPINWFMALKSWVTPRKKETEDEFVF